MDENLNNEIDEKKDLETETIIESKEEDDSLKNEIIKNNLESQYNFNCLVLSGGGSKGYSMLGALQYLYDKGYTSLGDKSKTIKNKELLQEDGSYMKAKDVNFDIKERNSRN